MQRINFTETTLNTLKRNANCSFANAVYKLGIKAQQGLKCDDLFKKSVLMNEVNKLLCKYKLDSCIVTKPEISAYVLSIYFPLGTDDTTEYSFYKNDVLVSSTYTNEDIVNYFLNVGFGSISQVPFINEDFIDNPSGWEAGNYNANIQNFYTINPSLYYPLSNTVSAPISAEFFDPKYSEQVADAYALSGDIEDVYSIYQNSTEEAGSFVWAKLFIVSEVCVDYTEEELNCITPQDLQVLYEFTHKYKETLAKSTKKITTQTTSNSNSNSSDCCEWGKISGSIGNQSDLISYLNTIEKNLISVSDESTEITSDLKKLKFTGNGVTATNSNGEVTVSIPGGGGGGSITASNGLTESSDNVKLGGTLSEDTTITQPDFKLLFTGTVPLKEDGLVNITTTGGLGNALTLNSIKTALEINATARGILINTSASPIGANGTAGSFLRKTDTNNSTIDDILSISRVNTANAASLVNSGVAISFAPGNNSAGNSPANSLLSLLYEDPTDATVQTKFRFSPLGAATTLHGFTLETLGSGKLKLPAYGVNAFTGTVAYLLAVDSSGNVIETSASGGGATDLGYTASPTNGIVTSSTGTDATLTLADGTNAGLLAPADFTKLGNQSGTNTGDNATNSTSNTYADGKVADAINDGTTTIAPSQNAVFDALALKSDKTFVESISLQDGGTSIAATTYTIELYANYAYTINELKIIADAGTCTANLKINSTSVTSISAVAVSNSIATATASGANTVAVGDKITLVTTSNSGLNNLQLTIKTTRI